MKITFKNSNAVKLTKDQLLTIKGGNGQGDGKDGIIQDLITG